ncbi:MAG: hypothetical protein U5N56_00025 [Candidatus Marinimicrobia bacterium]|nr:hypothetical protein [Candidatus Neomarinimicrobiota bacterium]
MSNTQKLRAELNRIKKDFKEMNPDARDEKVNLPKAFKNIMKKPLIPTKTLLSKKKSRKQRAQRIRSRQY